ncbi:MAG TPA: hypothetical protein VFZ52_13325 [Chryseolinea sp.]
MATSSSEDPYDYYNDQDNNKNHDEHASVNTGTENVADEFTACHREEEK